MESLKNPAMVVSTISLVGVLGSGVYFYKRLESLNDELQRYSDVAQRMGERMLEEDKSKLQFEQIVKGFNELKEKLSKVSEEAREMNKLHQKNSRDIQSIINALEEEGISIKLGKSKKKKGKKKVELSDSEEEEDSSESEEEDFLRQVKSSKKKSLPS